MLKKQTVWLLTMLSLVAILSVYYLTTPKEQMATSVLDQSMNKDATSSEEKVETTSTDSDEIFAQLRLQLNDDRSKMKEELQTIVASTNISEEERSEALDKMQELTAIASKENMLESLIVSLGYKEALVRAEENGVRVTVKADKSTPEAANEIIKMVNKEIGKNKPVSVEFQPLK